MSRRDRRVLRESLASGRGPLISDVDDDVLFTKMMNDAKAENDLLAQPIEINTLAAQVQHEFRKIKAGQSGAVRPQVITLCGSTRFKDEFFQEQERLTLMGNIVISVGLFGWDKGRPEDVLGETVKSMLDQLHFRKIDISDGIHVINKDGYVGESTAREIDYAMKLGKTVTYMEDEDDE